jgi:hypothetical protein
MQYGYGNSNQIGTVIHFLSHVRGGGRRRVQPSTVVEFYSTYSVLTTEHRIESLCEARHWVCSISIYVDISINEIYKPEPFLNKIILQKVYDYLFLVFFCSQLLYKIGQIILIFYLEEFIFF